MIETLCGTPPPRWANEAAVRDFVTERVRRDFENDAVVYARGWMLAESEARLYAVVALVDAAAERGSVSGSDR